MFFPKMIHVASNFLAREFSKQLFRNFCGSGTEYATHYEVLKLPRNCTQKDIKSAFIKLSKEYHPDKNVDSSTHNQFVRLNEAYTVLSRPETRREYDLTLVPHAYGPRSTTRRFFYDNDFADDRPNPRIFKDSSFWEHRDRTKDRENIKKPYYGIEGFKKVSNSWIVTILLLFALFGVGLQVLFIRKSVTFSRQSLDERSSRNSEIYKEVRARALEDVGDSALIQRLIDQSNAQRIANELNTVDE